MVGVLQLKQQSLHEVQQQYETQDRQLHGLLLVQTLARVTACKLDI